LDSKQISLYALDPSRNPRNKHFINLASSLVLDASGILAYAMHPNTLMCATDGFLSHHASCGVFPFTALVGH
jgi:hypothetical protein